MQSFAAADLMTMLEDAWGMRFQVRDVHDTDYTLRTLMHTSTAAHIGGGINSSKSFGTDCFRVLLVVQQLCESHPSLFLQQLSACCVALQCRHASCAYEQRVSTLTYDSRSMQARGSGTTTHEIKLPPSDRKTQCTVHSARV
eukprot:14822-Heterococcus_DN1.PRE.6